MNTLLLLLIFPLSLVYLVYHIINRKQNHKMSQEQSNQQKPEEQQQQQQQQQQESEFPPEVTSLIEQSSITDIPADHPLLAPYDHVKWIEYYKAAEAAARANNPATMWKDPQMCALRRLAGRTTLDLTLNGTATAVVDGEIRTITAPVPVVGKTVRTDYVLPLNRTRAPGAETLVRVVNMDSLSLAKQLIDRHGARAVACINMANQYEAGGGWRRGKFAQEEMLFHRTTLSRSLERELYPFEEFTCMLSHDVAVVRDDVEHGFRFLEEEERWRLNLLTVAAFDLNNPKDKSLPPLEFTEEMERKTWTKIASMLSLCADEGIEVVILSALGCGAFKNPPEKVSEIFKKVIQEYAGVFKEIYFGIKGSANAKNVVTFAKTLVSESIEEIPGMKSVDELKELSRTYKYAPPEEEEEKKEEGEKAEEEK